MEIVFLDYNSTTPVAAEVLSVMLPYFSEHFGNASSSHSYGQKALHAIDMARMQISKAIGANADEIIFTGNGTEANNLAIIGIAHKFMKKGNHIITSSIEHSSVYSTCKYLERCGFEVTYLPVDKPGRINLSELEASIKKETILISIMTANNETGVIQEIKDISKIAGKHNLFTHTDAVQALGKIPVNVTDLGIDLLSISAHKIYGPKGVGALYLRRGLGLAPIIHGGGQEKKMRAGTENVPGIAGFGKACELATANLGRNITHLQKIRNLFEDKIKHHIPGIKINSSGADRIPNTSSITFPDISSETLLVKLDLNGIAASSGSACGSVGMESSKTLKALGLSEKEQHCTIRFSFGLYTNKKEIDYAVKTLKLFLG